MGGIRIVCRECAEDLDVTLAGDGALTAQVGACGRGTQLGVRLGLQRLVAQMEGGDGVGAAPPATAKPARPAKPKAAGKKKAASGRLCACGCGHPAMNRPGRMYAYGHKPQKGAAVVKAAKPARSGKAAAPPTESAPPAGGDGTSCELCHMVRPGIMRSPCVKGCAAQHLVCSQCTPGRREVRLGTLTLKECPSAAARVAKGKAKASK